MQDALDANAEAERVTVAQRADCVPEGDIARAAEAAREAARAEANEHLEAARGAEMARQEALPHPPNPNPENNNNGSATETEDDNVANNNGVESLKVAHMLKRLRMRKKAANHIMNEQSINNVDMLITLDDDEITQLCKSCRKNSSGAPEGEGNPKGIPLAVVHETNFNNWI